MILVIGGSCQGKREFVEQNLAPALEQSPISPISWTDGASADWEGFMKGGYCVNFHLFIRRLMLGEIHVESHVEPHTKIRADELAAALMKANPDRILVTDEIGYGIVPVEPFDRQYREETGRICCLAARDASQVWRVCCGIGQRIK